MSVNINPIIPQNNYTATTNKKQIAFGASLFLHDLSIIPPHLRSAASTVKGRLAADTKDTNTYCLGYSRKAGCFLVSGVGEETKSVRSNNANAAVQQIMAAIKALKK